MRKTRSVAKPSREASSKSQLRMEPLPATFTLTAIFGMAITTVFTISGRIPLSWGVAFDIVFALMFISSIISITPRFPDREG